MIRKHVLKDKLYGKTGIYKISCTETDKVYIGESLKLDDRIQTHFAMLRSNSHHNPIL